MEIKFLGYGGAFDTHLVNSSAIIRWKGKNILVDCGHSVFPELVKTGYADQIDVIMITHLHDDHVGSLSSYLLYRFHQLKLDLPEIWVPTVDFGEQISRLLTFSLGKPERRAVISLLPEDPDIGYVNTFGLHVDAMQTFSYYFTDKDQSIVYSGDLGNCTFLFTALGSIPLKDTTVFHELTFTEGQYGHTFYGDLVAFTENYTIYGYHCDPTKNPKENPIELVANKPEFLVSYI